MSKSGKRKNREESLQVEATPSNQQPASEGQLETSMGGPEPAEKSGGKSKMAENDKSAFKLFSESGMNWFSPEAAKKVAAWYIDAGEKFGKEALGLQEKAMGWSKETPLGPLFEAQHTAAAQWLERSAHMARTLWRIE